jgi:hypothetical protein
MALLRFSLVENRLAILGRLALNIPVCIPDIHSINRFAGCACLSAIHFRLSATVHGMNGIVSEIGMSGCGVFATTCIWAFA